MFEVIHLIKAKMNIYIRTGSGCNPIVPYIIRYMKTWKSSFETLGTKDRLSTCAYHEEENVSFLESFVYIQNGRFRMSLGVCCNSIHYGHWGSAHRGGIFPLPSLYKICYVFSTSKKPGTVTVFPPKSAGPQISAAPFYT